MNIKDLPVSSDVEYTSLDNLRGNEKDIELLGKAYSSCSSETTAVLQYLFQHHVINDEDVAEVVKRIAVVEMRHHDILAEAITKIGGIPYYTNGYGGDFSTKCVYEGKDTLEMLRQNIKDEMGAVEYYEAIKPKLSSQRLVAIIDRIILDELIHIETFNKLIDYITFYKSK